MTDKFIRIRDLTTKDVIEAEDFMLLENGTSGTYNIHPDKFLNKLDDENILAGNLITNNDNTLSMQNCVKLECVQDVAPSVSVEGTYYFNTTDKKIYASDGTVWGTPADPKLDLAYFNKIYNQMLFWDGTDMVAGDFNNSKNLGSSVYGNVASDNVFCANSGYVNASNAPELLSNNRVLGTYPSYTFYSSNTSICSGIPTTLNSTDVTDTDLRFSWASDASQAGSTIFTSSLVSHSSGDILEFATKSSVSTTYYVDNTLQMYPLTVYNEKSQVIFRCSHGCRGNGSGAIEKVSEWCYIENASGNTLYTFTDKTIGYKIILNTSSSTIDIYTESGTLLAGNKAITNVSTGVYVAYNSVSIYEYLRGGAYGYCNLNTYTRSTDTNNCHAYIKKNGTREWCFSASNTLTFKVDSGSTYKSLVVTDHLGNSKLLSSLASINLCRITNGTYNVLLNSDGTILCTKSAIYVKDTIPVNPASGDYWLNTVRSPYELLIYNGTAWETSVTSIVPIGSIVLSNDKVTNVTTIPYNKNYFN